MSVSALSLVLGFVLQAFREEPTGSILVFIGLVGGLYGVIDELS
jgi:hypothetical protein